MRKMECKTNKSVLHSVFYLIDYKDHSGINAFLDPHSIFLPKHSVMGIASLGETNCESTRA
jgi:hypothetical protein